MQNVTIRAYGIECDTAERALEAVLHYMRGVPTPSVRHRILAEGECMSGTGGRPLFHVEQGGTFRLLEGGPPDRR